MTHISESAEIAYAAGIDPIGFAETEIASLLQAHFACAVRVAFTPGPHPDLTSGAIARRLIGLLLNCGWTAPGNAHEPAETEVTP
jgi:hypothetical protein